MLLKYDTIIRNFAIALIGTLVLYFLNPKIPEINTILIIISIEIIAIALSGFAAWTFTQLNFTHFNNVKVLGYIFLGVHICAGLSVLGVYIAQFS